MIVSKGWEITKHSNFNGERNDMNDQILSIKESNNSLDSKLNNPQE